MEENPYQQEEIKNLGPSIVPAMKENTNEEKPLSEDEYYSEKPSGYRFDPTDQELVVKYLKKKILNQALPPHMIRDVNIYDYHPQQLTEMYSLKREQVWYFFAPGNRKKRGRAAKNGYWKTYSTKIVIFTEGQMVGMKHELRFYEANLEDGDCTPTDWRMKEYSLDTKCDSSRSRAPDNMKLDIWVLCKICMTVGGNKNWQQDSEGMMITGPNEERPNAILNPQSDWVLLHQNRFYSSNVANYTGKNEGQGHLEPSDSDACTSGLPVITMEYLAGQMTQMISLQKQQSKELSEFVRETRQQRQQFDHHLSNLHWSLENLEDDVVGLRMMIVMMVMVVMAMAMAIMF